MVSWKALLKWMIWEYPEYSYFRKPPQNYFTSTWSTDWIPNVYEIRVASILVPFVWTTWQFMAAVQNWRYRWHICWSSLGIFSIFIWELPITSNYHVLFAQLIAQLGIASCDRWSQPYLRRCRGSHSCRHTTAQKKSLLPSGYLT